MSVTEVLMWLFFVFGLVLAAIAAWFYAIVSICDHPAAQFKAVGQNKWLWLGLNLVIGPLASAGYIIWARPALKRARQSGINVAPIEQITSRPVLYPYPVDDDLARIYSKPIGANEYFPEFDRDVA